MCHRNWLGGLGVAVLALSTAQAQTNPAAQAPAKSREEMSFEEIIPLGAVYEIPGMDKVEVRKNISYKTVDGRALRADVYVPPGLQAGARRPAVVFVSGGFDPTFEPRPKDWGIYISYGRLAAASGLVGVTFDHRLGYPRRQYEEGASDLADLIGYLRKNAGELRLDGDRIGVVVYSGGGPMLSPLLREPPPYVHCLGGIYPFLDTRHVDPEQAQTPVEVIREYSPLSALEASAGPFPPLFIARAGRDSIPGVNESIARFLQAALEKNLAVEFMNHPTGVHGFDQRNDDARSRYIIRELLRFLTSNLGAAPLPANEPLAEEDRASVQSLAGAYTAAWLRGETGAILDLFTEDAVLIPHHGVPAVEGKAAIRNFFWPPESPPTRVTQFTLAPREISGHSQLALVRGRFSSSFSFDSPEGPKSFSNEGNFLLLARRELDGTWRIARYMWNDPVPHQR